MSALKGLIIFASGGAVGWAITHFVEKTKYEQKLTVQLTDMENYYIWRHPDKKPREDGYATKAQPVVAEENATYEKPEYRDYTQYYEETSDPADAESPPDDEEENYYEGLALEKEAKENKGKEPKIINASDYGVDPMFGTLSLLYYTENDTLVIHDEEDESEDMIYLDEISDFIGDALDRSGFRNNNTKVLYVRNYRRSTDFEITKVRGSFEG